MRAIKEDPNFEWRRTQDGSIRSLNEGSETDDGFAPPDPDGGDRSNLINSARRSPSPLLAYVMGLLFLTMGIFVFAAGEMIATLIFCMMVIPLVLVAIITSR